MGIAEASQKNYYQNDGIIKMIEFSRKISPYLIDFTALFFHPMAYFLYKEIRG